MIGPIDGITIGQEFENRKALHGANVHRGLMRGIAPEGASIVLSGGYIDDEDNGDWIIYTGEGGRSPDTKRQITDQTLTGGNYALARNFTEGNPIRVNRGSNLDSKYAPVSGYRYDGLYRIDNYWSERGRDGFTIWRYRLVRLENETFFEPVKSGSDRNFERLPNLGTVNPPRSVVSASRIIRNTSVGNEIKAMYNYCCQICGEQLETPAGPYAECCHIKPLGRPHNGPDTIDNVLCLCPNHHVLFDTHAIHISDELSIIETGQKLRLINEHSLNFNYIHYHHSLMPDT